MSSPVHFIFWNCLCHSSIRATLPGNSLFLFAQWTLRTSLPPYHPPWVVVTAVNHSSLRYKYSLFVLCGSGTSFLGWVRWINQFRDIFCGNESLFNVIEYHGIGQHYLTLFLFFSYTSCILPCVSARKSFEAFWCVESLPKVSLELVSLGLTADLKKVNLRKG